MRGDEERRALIKAETDAFREYRAMPQTRILMGLLDVLIEDSLHGLATVEPDKLARRQGALAQLQALRRALGSDDPHASPRL